MFLSKLFELLQQFNFPTVGSIKGVLFLFYFIDTRAPSGSKLVLQLGQ